MGVLIWLLDLAAISSTHRFSVLSTGHPSFKEILDLGVLSWSYRQAEGRRVYQ
jgi:hypothetical protein